MLHWVNREWRHRRRSASAQRAAGPGRAWVHGPWMLGRWGLGATHMWGWRDARSCVRASCKGENALHC